MSRTPRTPRTRQQLPPRLRKTPRGLFLCTVSVHFAESSLLPEDRLCDIIFYESFYVKNKPLDWNDTGLDHFFEIGRSMQHTSIGASFYPDSDELDADVASGLLYGGLDKLRTMGVKHFGMLNLLADLTYSDSRFLQALGILSVDGEDITPKEVTEETGWRTAGARRAGAQRRNGASLDGSVLEGDGPKGHEAIPKTRVKRGVIKASRIPPLPREEIKIVIRPQGGLDILKIGAPTVTTAIFAAAGISTEESMEDMVCPNPRQNIVVVSTPLRRTNVDRYVRMRQLRIRQIVYEVNAYETAPDNTAKGVIRGIPIEDGPQELDRKIVNSRNLTALAAKRIGTTTTVIVAFDGLKVPSLVRYGATLLRCSLYRKKIDVCYKCGHLGHRMDVCPNPNNRVCRGCGLRNPDQGHQCNLKCDLCGGAHLTADKTCKARYKTPYLVRKRRWERQHAE
ncbi:hypothetical protein MTO96_005454 [Rhipicephalus appendiculatus]